MFAIVAPYACWHWPQWIARDLYAGILRSIREHG
jgi:hypothetical protein